MRSDFYSLPWAAQQAIRRGERAQCAAAGGKNRIAELERLLAESTAAHSVIAGKVAELEAENATLRRKLKEFGCEEISNVDAHIAALAPYPERRSE